MFRHIVCSLANRQGLFAYVIEHARPNLIQQPSSVMVVVTSLYNLVISSFPDNIMFYHACINMAVDLSCMMVPTTLFKSVRSSSHEQFAMNKPVNNHAQAGQLNHVQAG